MGRLSLQQRARCYRSGHEGDWKVSRELFVNLEEKRVVADCAAADVTISSIEKIPTGGVRLVLNSSFGAHQMKQKFKSHLITETVTRERFRPRKPSW